MESAKNTSEPWSWSKIRGEGEPSPPPHHPRTVTSYYKVFVNVDNKFSQNSVGNFIPKGKQMSGKFFLKETLEKSKNVKFK